MRHHRQPGASRNLALLAAVACVLVSVQTEAQPSVASPVLLDEVVAVVAGKFQSSVPPQVVTRWDLEAECRLESILRYGEAGVERPISQSLRATVLDSIIDEYIIVREALRLEEATVSQEEVAQAMLDMAGEMEADRFHQLLDSASLPLSKVKMILERRMVAERYVLDNLRLTVAISESDLESAFTTMNHPFQEENLDEVRDDFRDWLLVQKAMGHREKVIQELSSRCRVWIFYHPGGTEG